MLTEDDCRESCVFFFILSIEVVSRSASLQHNGVPYTAQCTLRKKWALIGPYAGINVKAEAGQKLKTHLEVMGHLSEASSFNKGGKTLQPASMHRWAERTFQGEEFMKFKFSHHIYIFSQLKTAYTGLFTRTRCLLHLGITTHKSCSLTCGSRMATLLSIHGNLFAMLERPPLRSQEAHKEAVILPSFPIWGFTYGCSWWGGTVLFVCLFDCPSFGMVKTTLLNLTKPGADVE